MIFIFLLYKGGILKNWKKLKLSIKFDNLNFLVFSKTWFFLSVFSKYFNTNFQKKNEDRPPLIYYATKLIKIARKAIIRYLYSRWKNHEYNRAILCQCTIRIICINKSIKKTFEMWALHPPPPLFHDESGLSKKVFWLFKKYWNRPAESTEIFWKCIQIWNTYLMKLSCFNNDYSLIIVLCQK